MYIPQGRKVKCFCKSQLSLLRAITATFFVFLYLCYAGFVFFLGDLYGQEVDAKSILKVVWLWLIFLITLTSLAVACALLFAEDDARSVENFIWFGASSLACVFGGFALLGSG